MTASGPSISVLSASRDGSTVLLGVVGALALWSALSPWEALTTGSTPSGPVLLCVLLVALTSGVLRALGANSWVSLPAALLVGLTVPLGLAGAGLLPTPTALSTLAGALADDLDAVNKFAVPIPEEGGTLVVLVTCSALALALALDLMLVRFGWVSGVGLVLLVLHVLPSYLATPARWQDFALTAALFVLLLLLTQARAEGPRRSPVPKPTAGATSGVSLSGDASPGSNRADGLLLHGSRAAATGATAIVVAALVTSALPLSERPWWSGSGPGGSGDEVTIANPLIDLRRDLTRGADVELLTVTGAGPAPSYLRTAVLTEYDGVQWRTGDRQASADDRAVGRLPRPPGLADEVGVEERDLEFLARGRFRSRWLPLPSQVAAVTADGDWRTDEATRDFVAWDPNLSTSGASWSATELTPRVTGEQLDSASSDLPDGGLRWTRVPRDLPPVVGELAREVTADAPTRFRQATALQQWFRSEFTYSLEAVESVGDDDLVAFLSPGGRVGYCEQFSASMALMARSLGIPARVAVGFLGAERRGPDTHVFSAHDLHAWPELYFEGAGWVRFEPTPGDRADDVPEYTRGFAQEEDPAEEPSAGPTSAVPTPSTTPSESSTPAAEPTSEQPTASPSLTWGRWGAVLAGVLAVLALLLLPSVLRRRRRTERLGSPDPEMWWTELRHTAQDLGVTVPEGLSPRQVAEVLIASDLVLTPALLDRVVRAVESARYAPAFATVGDDAPDQDDLMGLVEGMGQDLGAGPRARARWAPVSLLSR